MTHFMARLLSMVAAVVLALAVLTGCSVGKSQVLTETLYGYQKTIRWSENMADAMIYVDPEKREELTPSELDIKRYDNVRVSGYYDKGMQAVSDTEVIQVVEIHLINKHNQTSRTIIDKQLWRWDDDQGTWWLMSGLPKLDSK